MTTKHPQPEIGGVVVKGLAKLDNRLRHVLRDKCIDASLFNVKRGYSPMTGSSLTGTCVYLHWVVCCVTQVKQQVADLSL